MLGGFSIQSKSAKDSNNNEKKSGVKKNTKKKSKKEQAEDKPKKLKNKENTNNELTDDDSNIEEPQPPKIPKVKRQPLVPPGEWVVPEMEGTLNSLYDKLLNKTGSLAHTSANPEFKKEEAKPTTIELDFEESDKDDNFAGQIVDNVLVKLSNGVILETPR